MLARGDLFREGTTVGVLGGSVVALWFLVVDLAAGQALETPGALGAALFGGVVAGRAAAVIGYTLFHYAAFVAVGLVAAFSTRLAERQPVVLALFAVLFVVFQVGFYGMTAVLHMSQILGQLTWLQIAIGNVLATMAMGTYLWRAHPAISRNLQIALAN
jgi:hypothetical protein